MSSSRYVIPSMRQRTPRPATSNTPSSSSTTPRAIRSPVITSQETDNIRRSAVVDSTVHATATAPSSARIPIVDASNLPKSMHSMAKSTTGISGGVLLSTATSSQVASTSYHHKHPIPDSQKPTLRTTPSRLESFSALRDVPADTDAAQIILALIHDCFVFINQLYRGNTPESLFAQRYFLLSLNVSTEDVCMFAKPLEYMGLRRRYFNMEDLIKLRQKVLFASSADTEQMRSNRAESECGILQGIIRSLVATPPIGMKESDAKWYKDILEDIALRLDPKRTQAQPGDYRSVSSAIRSLLQIGPYAPHDPTLFISSEPLSTREVALLFDMSVAIRGQLMGSSNHKNMRLASLAGDHRLSDYDNAPRCFRYLVLARDAICGLLPGPDGLGLQGMFSMYFRTVLKMYKEWEQYRALCPEDRDVLKRAVKNLLHHFQLEEHDPGRNLEPVLSHFIEILDHLGPLEESCVVEPRVPGSQPIPAQTTLHTIEEKTEPDHIVIDEQEQDPCPVETQTGLHTIVEEDESQVDNLPSVDSGHPTSSLRSDQTVRRKETSSVSTKTFDRWNEAVFVPPKTPVPSSPGIGQLHFGDVEPMSFRVDVMPPMSSRKPIQRQRSASVAEPPKPVPTQLLTPPPRSIELEAVVDSARTRQRSRSLSETLPILAQPSALDFRAQAVKPFVWMNATPGSQPATSEKRDSKQDAYPTPCPSPQHQLPEKIVVSNPKVPLQTKTPKTTTSTVVKSIRMTTKMVVPESKVSVEAKPPTTLSVISSMGQKKAPEAAPSPAPLSFSAVVAGEKQVELRAPTETKVVVDSNQPEAPALKEEVVKLSTVEQPAILSRKRREIRAGLTAPPTKRTNTSRPVAVEQPKSEETALPSVPATPKGQRTRRGKRGGQRHRQH
ncbi:hypothetical protein BDZ89DRAFT_1081581 [Hymenopellis radicata]|nr:hypothetical protein BDZ89DRAFT_1081581 [Hymenopellis radicata]